MAIRSVNISGGFSPTITRECDSSADFSGISNNTIFKNLGDSLIYQKDSNGNITSLFFTGGTISGGLTISNGSVTMSNRPAFSVYGSGTTTNLTTTQNTTGTLNTNNFGLTYSQGSGFDISTGVFTAPIAGLYEVTLVGRNSGFSSGISQLAVVKNNNAIAGNTLMIEWASSSSMNHTGGAQIFKLAVGDTLRLKVLAGQINFDGNDNWSVAYIG